MNKNTKQLIGNILLCVSMTLLLLTAVMPLLHMDQPWRRYVFAAAALGTLIAQILIPSPGDDFRTRRLARMNVWSGIVYCVAAYCPFSSNFDMQRSWVAFMLAGAVLQIYATFMLSKLINDKNKKEGKEGKEEEVTKEVKDKE